MGDGDDSSKRKIAIVGVSSLLLVAMVVAVTVGVNEKVPDSKENATSEVTTTSKAVTVLCQPSTYKESCEKSLAKPAENTTDPKKLVQAGFEIAAQSLRESMKNSDTLKEIVKDPMAKRGLEICDELFETAIDDLKRSVDELGAFDPQRAYAHIDNLKTWLEATITFQENCKDGFVNTTGPAGDKMRDILKMSEELTSNGLAMVDGLAQILETLHIGGAPARKLMEARVDVDDDGFPLWVHPAQKRLLGADPARVQADMVVAQDGSGQYKTIMQAINAIPKKHKTPFVIKVKAGVYKEQVLIPKYAEGIVMIGDGPTKTRVTGSKNFAAGVQTSDTATFAVVAPAFVARDMGFENTAGAEGHQAVAYRSRSDNSVLYNCAFDGYQDTLYAQAYRQFYRDCTISGTIDFVFGTARTVLQNCKLIVRKPLPNQACICTAEGKKDPNGDSAIVLQGCHITADPEYFPVRHTNKAYLGRPWKEYSTTIVMNSILDDLIAPEGWLPWMGDFGLNTLFYAEFQNTGAGAKQDGRVKWKGIRHLTQAQIERYTPGKIFVEGDAWIRAANVPYVAGFMKAS